MRRNPAGEPVYVTAADLGRSRYWILTRLPTDPQRFEQDPGDRSYAAIERRGDRVRFAIHFDGGRSDEIVGTETRDGIAWDKGQRFANAYTRPTKIDPALVLEEYGPQIDYLAELYARDLQPIVDRAGQVVGSYKLLDWPFVEGA